MGWNIFFIQNNPHIPVAYIVLHIAAAIHGICLLAVLGTFFFRASASRLRILAIALSLPTIVMVIVLFAMKMIDRWF